MGNKESSQETDDKDQKFHILFEQLISEITSMEKPDIPKIEQILIEISSMYRLSMAETHLYRDSELELKGAGEVLRCYDTGKPGKQILKFRKQSSVGTIAEMTAYMSEDEEPLTEKERANVELTMRATLSFVSRNRMIDIINELTYYDEQNFLNFRALRKYLITEAKSGKLFGQTAVRYNLRHFSLINRELGRKAGDIIMKNHYNCLTDIVGSTGIVARLGGDNFVTICPTEKLGNVLAFLTEAPIQYESTKSVNISTTAGVYRINDDADIDNPGSIIDKSTLPFNIAQGGSADKIVFYDESLIKRKEISMRVQQLFPEALRNEEFLVYYQPKVNIMTGELVGAEALCRWFHDGKIVPPCDFIPMLEETNDICQLDFYMLDHVCRDIHKWIKSGHKSIRVSVNLSRKHMMNVNLLQSLLKTIDRHNIPHSCIEIELTETTSDVEFSDLKRVVKGLQSMGIFTSVDDFGIGYSSLNLIRELPWNVLKVDRSFLPTENGNNNENQSIMFKYVVAMAREMGIECIVEGVETHYQLKVLRSNHCDLAQGFYFDKPLPIKDFEQRLTKRFYDISNF